MTFVLVVSTKSLLFSTVRRPHDFIISNLSTPLTMNRLFA